jgi:hypothetical protein
MHITLPISVRLLIPPKQLTLITKIQNDADMAASHNFWVCYCVYTIHLTGRIHQGVRLVIERESANSYRILEVHEITSFLTIISTFRKNNITAILPILTPTEFLVWQVLRDIGNRVVTKEGILPVERVMLYHQYPFK